MTHGVSLYQTLSTRIYQSSVGITASSQDHRCRYHPLIIEFDDFPSETGDFPLNHLLPPLLGDHEHQGHHGALVGESLPHDHRCFTSTFSWKVRDIPRYVLPFLFSVRLLSQRWHLEYTHTHISLSFFSLSLSFCMIYIYIRILFDYIYIF